MPKFTYIGETKDGKTVTEAVEAKDRYAVYEVARTAGHEVHSVSPTKRFSIGALFNVEKIESMISRVSDDDLVMMTRNLGSMIEAGLPLTRALSVIERQNNNPKLKKIVTTLRERVSTGAQFHESLAEYPNTFSDLYVAMIKAGEESGQLSESLHTLGTQLERASSIKKKIRGAMIYPTVVLIVLVIIGILMMIYVMPSIIDTFESLNVDLPPTTEILIAISKALQQHTILVLSAMVLVVIAFIQFLRTTYGKIIASWVIPRIPVIGKIAIEANAARTARTLASLLSAGVDMIRSVNITEDVMQNVYYKRILAKAAKTVEQGAPLSEEFIAHEKLYPVLVGEMILVGEETGQIAQMLEELAVFYESEVEQKTKDLSTIIEPLLMVVIGGAVGFFALAMIAPIYSISDSI